MIYIKKIKIENFKSIEKEIISFNKGLNIIVGPNNAGKTNIMEAIDILLGDVYLPNFEPTTDHYFLGKEDQKISIEMTLAGDESDLKDIFSDQNHELKSQEVTIRFIYSKKNGGIFEVKINNDWQIKYNKPFGYYWDFEKKIFFLRVKSLRNIMEIAPIRWKSPLKYFKEIIIKNATEDKLNQFLSTVDQAKKKLSEIDEVKKIKNNLLKILKDQTEIKNIYFSPASTKHSDILNEMKILIDDGYISEVIKKGLGTQNITIIALFRLMAKYIRDNEKKTIIYGIDEPEIGLHPHAQRHLLKSLEKLAEYSQVLITTHSDNLIDVCNLENIIRIDKKNEKSIAYHTYFASEQKKILEIHGDNFKEIFFCKRALIVEGETEVGFFSEASKKIIDCDEKKNQISYSFDLRSVSVIDGEGDTIWKFVKLVKDFEIPFLLLIDKDKISNNNKKIYLNKFKEIGLIEEEKLNELINIKNESELIERLKKFNIFICNPFESCLCDTAKEETLKKIIEAIIFVKKNWGYNQNLRDFSKVNDINILKRKVKEYLSENKRKRIAKAIAYILEPKEYPSIYIEVIKQVSQL